MENLDVAKINLAEMAFLEMARFCKSKDIEARVFWTQAMVLTLEIKNKDGKVCLEATVGPDRNGSLNVEDFQGTALYDEKLNVALANLFSQAGFTRKS